MSLLTSAATLKGLFKNCYTSFWVPRCLLWVSAKPETQSPHPNPLPRGEGTAVGACYPSNVRAANSIAGFTVRRRALLPLRGGEGRGEGGLFFQARNEPLNNSGEEKTCAFTHYQRRRTSFWGLIFYRYSAPLALGWVLAHGHRCPVCPKGTSDNSPAFQRQVCSHPISVPAGRLNPLCCSIVHVSFYPFGRPCGT